MPVSARYSTGSCVSKELGKRYTRWSITKHFTLFRKTRARESGAFLVQFPSVTRRFDRLLGHFEMRQVPVGRRNVNSNRSSASRDGTLGGTVMPAAVQKLHKKLLYVVMGASVCVRYTVGRCIPRCSSSASQNEKFPAFAARIPPVKCQGSPSVSCKTQPRITDACSP